MISLDTLTDDVLAVMARTPDPRLAQVTQALVKHLHAFIQEVRPSEAEFEAGCAFLMALGQASSDKKNEVILASDILGASTLITLLNNTQAKGETDSALLGPFWRAHAPLLPLGASIADPATTPGEPLFVSGQVRNMAGQPLAGAVVDAWQASPVGLYENQDERQPDMNLRGRFVTNAEGRFHFRSVRPAGYPVPVDGPCGDLLRAQQRHPYRPAHVHFMVSHPGYRVLVTQVFADDDERLNTDVTFSVVSRLVGRFERHAPNECCAEPHHTLVYDMVLQEGELRLPTPPIP
jgi:catechol 1,2-dioxygenase